MSREAFGDPPEQQEAPEATGMMLTDRELQSLRNLGNEAEAAETEIRALHCDDHGNHYGANAARDIEDAIRGPNVRAKQGPTA